MKHLWSNTATALGLTLALVASCGGEEPSAAGASSAAVATSDSKPLPPPPKEALEACQGLAAGAKCTVTLGGKTLEGKCLGDPLAEGPLACVPPAPKQALEACKGLAPGESCGFVLDGDTVSGICLPGPPDKEHPPLVACAPPPQKPE